MAIGRNLSMNDPQPALHVSPIGENWEVESESGTLGQADTKVEAEELATKLARDTGVEKITVHTSDGSEEKAIAVAREQPSSGSRE